VFKVGLAEFRRKRSKPREREYEFKCAEPPMTRMARMGLARAAGAGQNVRFRTEAALKVRSAKAA
jgi:hypothetical protein